MVYQTPAMAKRVALADRTAAEIGCMQEPLYWDCEFECVLYSVRCKLFDCSGCHWQRGEGSLTSF